VLAETSLSRTALYRLMQRGQFPAQLQITQRTITWRAADVLAWIEARNTCAAKGSHRPAPGAWGGR
jgi:prophage regulatory protein